MGEYSYILEQHGKTTSEKLSEFTAAIGWRDELATYRIAQDEYEIRAAAAAEQGISLLDEPPYTAEELAALAAESAAYYSAFAANYVATAAFTGSGSGTQGDPYIITNRAQLEAMADDLTAYYQLANDIDLGGSGSPWVSMGSTASPFQGYLDGNGYWIQNLYDVSGNGGLFEKILHAQITNLGIYNAYVQRPDTDNEIQIGVLSSYSTSSTISSIYIDAANCVGTKSRVSSGFVGVIEDTQISNCIISADLSGQTSSYGAPVGWILGTGTVIERIYCMGDISTGSTSAGVVMGNTDGVNSVSASVSLISSISGPGHRIVSVGGSATFTPILNNNFANDAMIISGSLVSGGTTSNQDGADVSPSTYHTQAFWQNTLGWDFDTVWYWDDTEQLPKLRAFLHGPIISSVSATPATGGTTTQITLSATDGNSYQWQYSTNGGSSWQNIPGATAIIATWTPGAVGTYQVRLLATNSDGTTTSDPVTVTIYPDPTISDVSIYPNPSDESATFHISAVVNEP